MGTDCRSGQVTGVIDIRTGGCPGPGDLERALSSAERCVRWLAGVVPDGQGYDVAVSRTATRHRVWVELDPDVADRLLAASAG